MDGHGVRHRGADPDAGPRGRRRSGRRPLISVDTGAVEDRLRAALPRIDSVDVVRSWPHGIGLKVTERKPVLLIEKGGKFIEVDADGRAIRHGRDRAPKAFRCSN